MMFERVCYVGNEGWYFKQVTLILKWLLMMFEMVGGWDFCKSCENVCTKNDASDYDVTWFIQDYYVLDDSLGKCWNIL